MRKIVAFFVFVLFVGLAATARSQCRTMDRNIEKPLKLTRARSAVVRDTIRVCTSHTYRFKAARGKLLGLRLTTGDKTSMTLLPPSGEALVDGGLVWSGRLTESGEYEIQIGTDATARYTLTVTIRE